MEKHLEIFSKQNPVYKCECKKCGVIWDIPTKDILKKKYEYELKCKSCGETTKVITKDLHKKLEFFKKLVS